MGFWSGIAKRVMDVQKKIEATTAFLGDVTGSIVEGTGYVVADITDVVGLDGTARFIRDSTKTAGETIKGTAKIIGATNTAISSGAIGVIGEATGNNELVEISFDNEPDSDILDELKKIIDNNAEHINKYSGAAEFQKLQNLYHSDYTKITKRYRQEVDNIFNDIKCYIDVINEQRSQSAVYFEKFEDVSSLIAEWSVEKYRFKEIPELKLKVPDRSKDSTIFKDVNYDEHPIWMRIKGLFGGNKAAFEEAKNKIKESLQEIENKCDLEKKRWTAISGNLNFIRDSFVSFNDLYIHSISELRYSIDFVQNTVYQKDIFFFSKETKINPYFLPEKHLHCLMACDRLSRLLCEMSKRKYLDDKSEIIKKDIELIKDNQKLICESKKAA